MSAFLCLSLIIETPVQTWDPRYVFFFFHYEKILIVWNLFIRYIRIIICILLIFKLWLMRQMKCRFDDKLLYTVYWTPNVKIFWLRGDETFELQPRNGSREQFHENGLRVFHTTPTIPTNRAVVISYTRERCRYYLPSAQRVSPSENRRSVRALVDPFERGFRVRHQTGFVDVDVRGIGVTCRIHVGGKKKI